MAFGKKKEDPFFTMFKDFAKKIEGMGSTFGEIINKYENIERPVADMKLAETECDSYSHAILDKLNESFITPFDREDIFTIVNQMDDLADYLEEVAQKFIMYDIEKLPNDAVEMGNIIVDSVKNIEELFDGLPNSKKSDKAQLAIIEINRLENLGDAVYRRTLTKLFREEKDPITVIKWKDIYRDMEDTLDACEHLADTISGLMVKNA